MEVLFSLDKWQQSRCLFLGGLLGSSRLFVRRFFILDIFLWLLTRTTQQQSNDDQPEERDHTNSCFRIFRCQSATVVYGEGECLHAHLHEAVERRLRHRDGVRRCIDIASLSELYERLGVVDLKVVLVVLSLAYAETGRRSLVWVTAQD